MNAIEKFAREHGAEYNPDLETKFKDAVQSVIGNKGKVVDAWSYNNSVPGDDYHTSLGYIDWWSEIRGMDGMAPNTYIVICLSTDLEFMSQWLTCFYRDENGNDLTTDYSGDVGNFDPFPLIDKCLKQAGKSESKKNERGSTQIETYDGFDELLGYADAEYLLEDVVDVLSQYYTYEDETFDEDQAKDDPEFTIKIEGGDERADYYYENIFYVHLPNKEAAEELAKVLGGELSESKKPESCKDGKKESMERCDSCGAVMTEYDYDRYGGFCKRCRDKGEAKKPEDASSVDDLLARHNQKWLVKVSYDVDASHSAVAPSIVRADTKDAATNIALKRHRGLGDNMKVVSVEPMTESRKKSEGVGGKIKMGIDYNMFMRMCASAAYLDENEDYWDALWEYYSEMGEIEDACEFFDNLFQYTSWCDEDEVYDEYLDDSYKDGTKSKAECIEAAVDAGDLDVFKTDKGYLVIQ